MSSKDVLKCEVTRRASAACASFYSYLLDETYYYDSRTTKMTSRVSLYLVSNSVRCKE